MENATKALLIAAAVLIVILLIAFGMRIFNSTSGVSKSGTDTGKELTNQANLASNTAQNAMQGLGGWYQTTY
mgnify:FL=1